MNRLLLRQLRVSWPNLPGRVITVKEGSASSLFRPCWATRLREIQQGLSFSGQSRTVSSEIIFVRDRPWQRVPWICSNPIRLKYRRILS